MKKMNEKGFTLVELIVVMAVLAVISAIAVPRFLGVQKEAKVDADYATAAMLGKAAELYLVKEDGSTVSVDALNTAALGGTLEEKLKTTEIKFVSENYIGQESSITFDESTGGTITVSATGKDAAVKILYPRQEPTPEPPSGT
jgi:type IV pilus assembly protein PilA